MQNVQPTIGFDYANYNLQMQNVMPMSQMEADEMNQDFFNDYNEITTQEGLIHGGNPEINAF